MCSTKELGQWPTPVWAAEVLVEQFFSDLGRDDLVIEPACGPGAFLTALPEEVPALGIDIDKNMVSRARRNTGREVLHGDFRTIPLTVTPTAIIGNPPFQLDLVDEFLDRAFELLPTDGRLGFILPSYSLQTAARVTRYAERWSLSQTMIPRNIFAGLSKPLVFAMFSKDRRKAMIGFALYKEAADVQGMKNPYRSELSLGEGSVWFRVVDHALNHLGGEAHVSELYREIKGARPTRTEFWKEQVRRTLRRYSKAFIPKGEGRYERAPLVS